MTHHLVTGGAGFIGSALTHRLIREGHTVTVLDRFSRGKAHRVPPQAKTVIGDIRNPSDVKAAAAGCQVIWHLAYIQGTQTFYANPKDVIDVALRGIVNVLDASQDRDLFLVSSSETYQTPPAGMFPTDETVPLSVPDVTNPRYSYGAGKIASEVAVLAHAEVLNRAVIVRPHNVYGPDMGHDHVIPQFAQRMAQILPAITPQPFAIQGTGNETRSFCHINDCIDGLMVLLDRGENGNVYHLGNPNEEHTIKTLAHKIADWWGKAITVVPGQLPEGSPVRRLPSIDKIAALGYRPQVSLYEGLDGTLNWYRNAVKAAA